MRCGRCAGVCAGGGRCTACGAVNPIDGEELVAARPVQIELPLDRRLDRTGAAERPPPPVALCAELELDRREVPRRRRADSQPPLPAERRAAAIPASLAHLPRAIEGRPPEDVPLATGSPRVVVDLGVADVPGPTAEELELLPPRASRARLLLAWSVDLLLLAGPPAAAVIAAARERGGPVPPSLLAGGAAVSLLAALVYLGLCGLLGGRTVGDRAAGLRVVLARTGMPPPPGAAVVRAMLAVGAGLAIVPVAWALLDRRGRGLHDLLAGTMPVREEPAELGAPVSQAGAAG